MQAPGTQQCCPHSKDTIPVCRSAWFHCALCLNGRVPATDTDGAQFAVYGYRPVDRLRLRHIPGVCSRRLPTVGRLGESTRSWAVPRARCMHTAPPGKCAPGGQSFMVSVPRTSRPRRHTGSSGPCPCSRRSATACSRAASMRAARPPPLHPLCAAALPPAGARELHRLACRPAAPQDAPGQDLP